VYPLRTILAATDFTPRSRAVAGRAAALARQHGARLVIVHALPTRKRPVSRLRLGKAPDPMARAEAEMERLRDSLPDVPVEWRIAAEKPHLLVPRIAQEIDADLIVLGLHLARRVLDTMRLTTLERITKSATCPVLIAHNPEIRPYGRVLGAITFAPASARALEVAAGLAPEAEFHAIHALQLPLRAKLPSADMMTSAEMTEADLLRQAFMGFKGLPAAMPLPEIVPGGVHEVLQFRIDELQPDLVVIGSHSGRDPNSLGNYTRDLMRAPPTDMLVAKPC
jgi:nucleotide-binding universal stress UspA family protein